MICSSGVYLTTSRNGQWSLWLCNFNLWFVKEIRTRAPFLWQLAHIVYTVISEYLCKREETWQVMSNRLLKSISSFRDTTIFQRILYAVSRWKVPGVITWISAYQRSARHSSWSGCAWLQAWWQALLNSHRTKGKKANWHKCIAWRFTSQLCALCTECMTCTQNGNCMNIVRICDCSVFHQCVWLLVKGADTPVSLQRDRNGDGILVIFYIFYTVIGSFRIYTVNREHEMLLYINYQLDALIIIYS